MSAETLTQHWQAFGKPMLGHQSFVQRTNIGTKLAHHHHTSIGPTKVQYEISLVGQCQPNIGKPSLHQHWTNKGPTSDIIGEPILAKQWFYAQCIYVSDEENYKPVFPFNIFLIDFSSFSFFFEVQMKTMRRNRK